MIRQKLHLDHFTIFIQIKYYIQSNYKYKVCAITKNRYLQPKK